ncbi:MAG: response regulator transcription factor [Magnetococcales bacterium]|nr:response regulator transcription factor [Magnetococcales bacterium]
MLSQFLSSEGYLCDSVHNGLNALEKVAQVEYKAIILDIMMPKMDGFEFIKRLRKISQTPVLMLTARGEDDDAIIGFEHGADDYLAKPCNPKVLLARLRAVLRRSELTFPGSGVLVDSGNIIVGDVEIHPGSRQITIKGKPLELTSAEYKILTYMIRFAGQIVSKENVSINCLSRKLSPFDRSIDFHISSLRKKMGDISPDSIRIITIRGEGYQFTIHDKE